MKAKVYNKVILPILTLWVKIWAITMIWGTLQKVKQELKIDLKWSQIKFSNEESENLAYTDIQQKDIIVTFYLKEILSNWYLGTQTGEIVVDFYTFIGLLARHEFRHVWQFQNAFAETLNEGYKPYQFQYREQDANEYALGYTRSLEEYVSFVTANPWF